MRKGVRAISGIGAILIFGLCCLTTVFAQLVFVLELPITLAFGWVTYLGRVVPQADPDPWAVGTAVACLVGVTVGSHFFLRWLAGSSSDWPWGRTLRCVGLVVLMFVAGIAVVGMIHQTSWLVRSPEPLIRSGRRTVAQIQSQNHLKEMGFGAHFYHDANKELLHSSFDAAGRPLHSWQARLLPYIEQGPLYSQIDLQKPWTHPANAEPMGRSLRIYLNPAFGGPDKLSGFGASYYAGNAGIVLGGPKTPKDSPAGLSNTILAGEVATNFRPWGDPLNARDPRLGPNGHPHGFGGPNGKPAQFAMLDGSVRTFDPKELADALEGK